MGDDKDLNLIQLFENHNTVNDVPKVIDTYLKNAPSKKISGFLLTFRHSLRFLCSFFRPILMKNLLC